MTASSGGVAGGVALVRLGVASAVGAAAAAGVWVVTGQRYAPAVGWVSAVTVFLAWTWLVIGPMNPQETAAHAGGEDPTRRASEAVLLLASVATLGGVALLLVGGASPNGVDDATAFAGVACVAASWLLVHTVFTLRYARLYYTPPVGGIDFNQQEGPAYVDFAYLAFTVGMTFQVSDTDLRMRSVRATVLRHMLLSYLLGAVVLAMTLQLVAGLGTKG